MKKIIAQGTLTLTALALIVNFAQADNCVRVQEYYLQTTYTNSAACAETQPLQLNQGFFSYQNFKDNPYLVRYWLASFKKVYKAQHIYARDLVNICTGQIIKSLPPYTKNETIEEYFQLINPNLDPDLISTIDLASYTEDEAIQMQIKLLKECQEYSPTATRK